MILTLEKLFNDNLVIKAVIDRLLQTQVDTIYWQRYLDFEQTVSRLFKTYFGTVTGVTMGSIIDKNGRKPLRGRQNLGSGVGEVAALGNAYQLDNDRLDTVKTLIDKFNAAGQGQPAVMTDIINFLADDIRQCTLAPHKRMDYIVGQLRSKGTASVKLADNPQGIELIDITLPVIPLTPTIAQKAVLISYLQAQIQTLKATVGIFGIMEMNQSTFNTHIATCDEFKSMYKMTFGGVDFAMAGGLMTTAMANQFLVGVGLPAIRIVEEYVVKEDGTTVNCFADDRITLLRQEKIGKMMWHTPYEITDPVPNKVYTGLAGGHFISTLRTEEGRFTEYMAEWMPNFSEPNKIVIIDLTAQA